MDRIRALHWISPKWRGFERGVSCLESIIKNKTFREERRNTFIKTKTLVLKCSKTQNINLSSHWAEFCIELDTNSPNCQCIIWNSLIMDGLYLRFLKQLSNSPHWAGLQNIHCVVLDRKYNRYDTVILVKHFLTKLASIDEL